MRRARVALQLLDHRVAERTLRQHALDGLFQRPARKPGLHLAERRRPDAARITAVPVIELVVGLVAGDANLVDVRHDDEIARVHVRRVDRLVLAAQAQRDPGREPAEHLVGCVDDVPGARDVAGPGREGFHRRILSFPPGRAPEAAKFSKVNDCTILVAGPSIRGPADLFKRRLARGEAVRRRSWCSATQPKKRRGRVDRAEDSTIGGEWRNASAVPKEEDG